jgi:hypothetical protein
VIYSSVREVHVLYTRRYDLMLFSAMDVNRPSSVVNAVLRGDGVVYGTHIITFFSPLRPF